MGVNCEGCKTLNYYPKEHCLLGFKLHEDVIIIGFPPIPLVNVEPLEDCPKPLTDYSYLKARQFKKEGEK